MQSVKSTTFDRTKTLYFDSKLLLVFFIVSLIVCPGIGWTQDNSPYSRYGLGDLVPSTNVNSRSMGGVSAGVSTPFSINFNNPASYALFQSKKEENSRKLSLGKSNVGFGS